jgi:hypothetical protein
MERGSTISLHVTRNYQGKFLDDGACMDQPAGLQQTELSDTLETTWVRMTFPTHLTMKERKFRLSSFFTRLEDRNQLVR